MRIAAISLSLATVIVAGCAKQAQQSVPNDAQRAVAQTAAPIVASTAPAAQKGTPVMVFSAANSAPKPTPAPSANQVAADEEEGRLDLPEEDENVVLQAPARTALEGALATANGNGPVVLPDDATGPVVDSLDSKFRNSCTAVVANWIAKEEGSARWTAQILFSMRGPEGINAVLAIRCGTTVAADQNLYDERPAIVSITPEAATLKLVPLSARENGDETLYHLSFSQAFRAPGAQLVELDAYHTSDNRCCGGADEESGSRKVIVDLAAEKIALSRDERLESDSHDDSSDDADAETVCESKFDYVRSEIGNVTSIVTETRCTENQKPKPEAKRQTFAWNAETHQFVLVN